MFYTVKDGKITGSSTQFIKEEGTNTIEIDFSNDEISKINNGYSIVLDDKGKFLELSNTEESNKKEKIIQLKSFTLQQIIDSEDDLTGILSGKELGELLSDKFFGGNIYKELQLHRVMLQKLLKVVIKNEELTEDELSKINELELMDKQAEQIINKF